MEVAGGFERLVIDGMSGARSAGGEFIYGNFGLIQRI